MYGLSKKDSGSRTRRAKAPGSGLRAVVYLTYLLRGASQYPACGASHPIPLYAAKAAPAGFA